MKLSNLIKISLSFILAFILTQIHVAMASETFIPTSQIVEKNLRAERAQKTRDFLEKEEVKQMLTQQGISPEEAQLRIASLSDEELEQLTNQIEETRAGGNILVTVLLVVLIIFLIKRM